MKLFAGQPAFDVHFQLDRFPSRQPVEHAGDGARDARAHQHIIHAREHRAENRRQRGELDFFQKVDADRSVMSLFGKKYFREIGRHGERHVIRAGLQTGQRRELEGRIGGLAAGDEIIFENFDGHARHGEMFEGVAHLAVGIAVLQPPGKNAGERGAGNNAQLAGLGQTPVGNSCAHSALDDLWM